MFSDQVLMFVLSTIKEYKMKKFALALALLVIGTVAINPKVEASMQQLLLAQAQPESSEKTPELKIDLGELKLPQTTPANTRNPNAKKVEALIEKAAKRADSGDLKGALQDVNQALRLDPNNPAAYYVRGGVYYYQRNYKQAIADSTKAIQLLPDNYPAYAIRGAAYYDSGNKQKGLADLRKSVSLAEKYGNKAYAQEVRDLIKRIQ
jgi:tetratricopeptide (TPR) repeat protein